MFKIIKKRITIKNLQSKFSLKANEGFVSMIALLLANIFLIIGLSVFNIAIRELTLSSGARESLFAFYAADGGMECALYHDRVSEAFEVLNPNSTINCDEQEIAVTSVDLGGGAGKSNFIYSFDEDDNNPCVQVEVNKNIDGTTTIYSRGQNTCDINNARRVERAWKVSF